MAILHSETRDGTRYEVRTAGHSRRLYTNGVLHTQYHPGRRVTGGVWDLLALPALVLPQARRVLLLGVGGGAAVHLLRDWCPGVAITGVELNPVHLRLGRRFFGLGGPGLTLVQGDAKAYVEQYAGEPFDLVIEDLFGGNGVPDRSFAADRSWCNALGRLVSAQGALVINTLERRQLRDTALLADARVRAQWPGRLCLTLPAYANVVGAFFRTPVTPAQLRRAVRSDATRLQQERRAQLRYRIGQLG